MVGPSGPGRHHPTLDPTRHASSELQDTGVRVAQTLCKQVPEEVNLEAMNGAGETAHVVAKLPGLGSYLNEVVPTVVGFNFILMSISADECGHIV